MTADRYDESSIQVLKNLDGIKSRPSMYIGDVGSDGFHHLVQEIVDNALDEVLAGHCNKIALTFHKDNSVSVEDNGRGIPVKEHPTEKIPTVDVVFTMLHAGGKFDKKSYAVSGGLHGVGASVVNALSEWLDVTVKRDGKKWFRRYEKSEPTEKTMKVLESGLKAKDTGTLVTFKPDMSYFKGVTKFSKTIIFRRLRELAYLNSGLEIKVTWEEDGEEKIFKYEKGLIEYVDYLMGKKEKLHEPIHLKTENIAGCSIELVFVYEKEYDEAIHSFANNINTVEGGIHYNAALDSLTKVVQNMAESMGLLKNVDLVLNKSDVMEGLTLVISVLVPEPQFGGQTKTKLVNDDLRKPFGDWMLETIEKKLRSNKEVGELIVNKIIETVKARDTARKAKDLFRKKSGLSNRTLAGKLKDCSCKNPELCEIFIVEGDSAGGSSEDARDRTYQAVLPLRGKVLNVNKTSLNKALENKEIASLISALNVSVVHGEASIDGLRYHKVICLADADVDGSHILCLLFTLFHKHMRKLIESGHVYVCELPLYRVRCRGKIHYLKNDAELEEFKKKNADVKLDINRFKGLGEMNAEQLEEVAMNPSTRILKMVHLGDEVESLKMVDCLMGDDIVERKAFLQDKLKFEEEK